MLALVLQPVMLIPAIALVIWVTALITGRRLRIVRQRDSLELTMAEAYKEVWNEIGDEVDRNVFTARRGRRGGNCHATGSEPRPYA